MPIIHMSQLHFYVPDDVEKQLRARAKKADMPLSRYLAELVKARVGEPEAWPEGYFETVFGGWQGEPLERAPQGKYEKRHGIE